MKIVDKEIHIEDLKEMASQMYGLVKAVVDVERGIFVIDGQLHSDEEAYLLDLGSKQENLWGINIYPEAIWRSRIEFDSMINVRPSQGNNSRGVEILRYRKRFLRLLILK